jgi:hypothetical protein
LAHEFYDRNIRNALFLRAERTRTFKLLEGEPLPTSFGEDLYKGIFVAHVDRFLPDSPKIRAAAPVAGEIVQRQLG